MNIELDYIKKLAKLVNENSLEELALKDGDVEITLKKGSSNIVEQVIQNTALPSVETFMEEETPKNIKKIPITSPMVGSFYASANPNSKPFVKIGDTVAAGQIVCIIEAMKLMNEIETEVSGKVVEICVEDGQSVEYGQVLMYVE